MLGQKEFGVTINYHWSVENGMGQVVGIGDDEGTLKDGIKRRNERIGNELKPHREHIAGWTVANFNGDSNELELAVARYTAALDEQERKRCVKMGKWLNEGDTYQMEGVFEDAPVNKVHKKAPKGSGAWATDGKGNVYDGTHE